MSAVDPYQWRRNQAEAAAAGLGDAYEIRVFAWCVAEAWAAGRFDLAEEWASSAWDIADGRVLVDDGRLPEEEHPGVTP